MIGAESEQRIDVDATERLRTRPGELLEVDAALGSHHREVVAAGAIQQERRVELPGDRQELLDEDARDGEPLEGGADHPVGGRGSGLGGIAELDPAGLAAAADLHLDLHDRPAAELPRGGGGVLPAEGDDAAGRLHPLGAEQILAHVLVEIHAAPVRPSR